MHTPLTRETRGSARHARNSSLLPKGAVVVNTARGPIIDIDALATLLKSGHLAGVGLDVVPVEPPVEPVPELLRAYRAQGGMDAGSADHHAPFGVLYPAGLGRHPQQIRRNHARRAAGAAPAERHSTGQRLRLFQTRSRRLKRICN